MGTHRHGALDCVCSHIGAWWGPPAPTFWDHWSETGTFRSGDLVIEDEWMFVFACSASALRTDRLPYSLSLLSHRLHKLVTGWLINCWSCRLHLWTIGAFDCYLILLMDMDFLFVDQCYEFAQIWLFTRHSKKPQPRRRRRDRQFARRGDAVLIGASFWADGLKVPLLIGAPISEPVRYIPGGARPSVDRWVRPWSTLGGSWHPVSGAPD